MSKLSYKIDVIITKIKYKLFNNKKVSKFLNSRIIYTIMGLLFIIFIISFLYDLYDHRGTYKFFKKYIYRIREIDVYVSYGLIVTGIYWIYIGTTRFNILKKIQNRLSKITNKEYPKIKKLLYKLTELTGNIYSKINKLLFVYIVYSIIIYTISILELKTKILSITTPLIVYFGYNIYNYIEESKEKYKFKFLIDSRYFFLIALVLLIYTPIFIYLEDKDFAETLSIYAYYFLVGGVIYEIISSKFMKK